MMEEKSVIQATIDLVKEIAAQRRTELRVIPKTWEYQPFQALLIPVHSPEEKYFGVWSPEKNPIFEEPLLENPRILNGQYFTLYPFDFCNLQKCANEIPVFKPTAAGVITSFGTGDRLGLVSAAHLNALKKYDAFPVIAQQSPRELEKTGRSFQSVLVDAAWGVFVGGYRGKFGADADHIKDESRLLQAMESGFSFYTLDASEVMERSVLSKSEKELVEAFERLSSPQLAVYKRYLDRTLTLANGFQIDFREKNLLPILLAYFPVIDFIEHMNTLLDERISHYDLEISLDESDAVTSFEAHFLVAEELHRRGIDFQSLALKFPGSFEKGIDYRGDPKELEWNLRRQAIIVRNIGGYRLSLHSGSDKFSIYPVFFQETEGLFHVKTSGTSWLKALETVAVSNPELFRKIYDLSLVEIPENRKAYQISLDVDSLPQELEYYPDKKLVDLLKNDSLRQLLHISYGSVLRDYRQELCRVLFHHEEDHFKRVQENIENHLKVLMG